MKETPLLAMLAQLCGDIITTPELDGDQLLRLQTAIATALFNAPPVSATTPGRFQFDRLEDFATRQLATADFEQLGTVLQRLQQENLSIDKTIRVARREVPFVSSQVRGSIPDWARGANIVDTLGPFTNRDGRQVWFDFYRIIPVVQVWLKGANRPFMLCPIEESSLVRPIGPRTYKIPKGSVWLHADLFAPASPDNLYCGLTVNESEISFTGPLGLTTDNKLIVPNGMEAAVKLNLLQKVVTDVSPDDNGIDVRNASIELPKKLSFTLNHTGKSLTVDNARWNLYGQDIGFTFDNTGPIRWNAELNRITIPFKASAPEFTIANAASPVCTVAGKALIAESAWAISGAIVDIAAPLQADGTGAMAIGVLGGLEVSWLGLKDSNLAEKSSAALKNALVMLMPGRINIATLFASSMGKQRYHLWQEIIEGIPKPVQYIDLSYTRQFFFFYDSLQAGTESVAAQANCTTSIDKPVKVNGTPFKVESLQTIFSLTISKALQLVLVYDDNIIEDNWSKTHKPVAGVNLPVTFETSAIALNNALLTVSPVTSMLLYGDLKNEDTFEKCLLIYGFGLLQYLPTLPDPYAANIGLLRRRSSASIRNANAAGGSPPNVFALSDIDALLVCLMTWKEMDAPEVNFFMGDKPAAQANVPGATARQVPAKRIRLDALKDPQVLQQYQRETMEATNTVRSRQWQNVTDNQDIPGSMLSVETRNMMMVNESFARGSVSPFRNAFALLDVSTNADLMGISLSYASDDFAYNRTHAVKEEITGSPISISGLDVQATSRLVQVYALPQISWEPVINITTEITNMAEDPHPGLLYFMNDGVPAQIANNGNEPVSLAPIPLTGKLSEWYDKKNNFLAWSYFTLPSGMMALAMYYKQAGQPSPKFELVKQQFQGELNTGLQIKTEGLDDPINRNKIFRGSAHQLPNAYNLFSPATGARSILSGSVTEIFNDEFGTLTGFDLNKYVPLERYDFSGYGANVFSHWVNQNAALAQTSQAMFDVWKGRTAHEVIQVKSVLYPWGIRVVRTITIYRGSNAFEWRVDSGWKAESDGIYDFRTPIKDHASDSAALKAAKIQERARTYVFHPGMVEGVYNVRNIKEDNTLAPFTTSWTKTTGVYIDDLGHPKEIAGSTVLDVKLVPVYFDADVKIDDIIQGAQGGKVLSQRMLGYLQLRPRGVFIDQEDFANLLTVMEGLGGPVDCIVNINQSKQQMRVTRVEVNPSKDAANKRVFVTAAKGTPILPKDGSWSVVQHNSTTKEVTPLSKNDVIPLVRAGAREFLAAPPADPTKLPYNQNKTTNPVNIAEATELFKGLEARAKQFGFLQSTGENKVLFRNPLFQRGVDLLKGSVPDLADAYRLMNSKGIFPKLENLPKMDQIGELANQFGMKIIDEGYKLLNNTIADAEKKLVQLLPEGPWYIVKTNDVKVYVDYKPTKTDGSTVTDGGGPVKAKLDFDIDSKAAEWVNKMNDVTMVVDLGPFKRLLLIRGKFDTKKNASPSFIGPELEFGPDLKPVVDILVLLSQLSVQDDYKGLLQKGLKIAMSNSPNNWEYKFQADKEIPVIKFPPPKMDTAAAPLRLEAGLKVGVYFNVAVPLPPTNGIPTPGAGAFVEFYGKLSVMCVSVGVGTIYAVGQVTVRISADTIKGPALYMKFGFGVEAVVALPVIGSVSVYFAVGVEMSLDSTQVTVAGFVLFKGRAEILGGIVTVTIQIEASGKVQKRIGGPDVSGETNMIAQVTFSLDISICFIIDISFTESWQEQRKIA
ncbi:hypothetical protein EXU57_07120 [Segetibacter sp. 3557_3]|uniref:hypothetical protein n=1 Tax=Segetibacter sp. 3557_3 TaxID=2547429 RepID=UPI001058979C|nr:hypothetical protein [Segetibacter sp. 3557_3]TDH27350.1 hypothetical protein EXU57_07120 [Segetibacter sp. 3557_3]